MINPGYCYKEIDCKSSIMDDLLLIADNSEPFVEYFNFGIKFVPKDVFLKDSFLKSLHDKHTFNAAILLIRSKNIYNWHIDDNRGASLNMMIRGDNSHCLFSNEPLEVVNSFIELEYKPSTYYLLNTQRHHSVINFGEDRLMFSIEFDEDKNSLDYYDLLTTLGS